MLFWSKSCCCIFRTSPGPPPPDPASRHKSCDPAKDRAEVEPRRDIPALTRHSKQRSI